MASSDGVNDLRAIISIGQLDSTESYTSPGHETYKTGHCSPLHDPVGVAGMHQPQGRKRESSPSNGSAGCSPANRTGTADAATCRNSGDRGGNTASYQRIGIVDAGHG